MTDETRKSAKSDGARQRCGRPLHEYDDSEPPDRGKRSVHRITNDLKLLSIEQQFPEDDLELWETAGEYFDYYGEARFVGDMSDRRVPRKTARDVVYDPGGNGRGMPNIWEYSEIYEEREVRARDGYGFEEPGPTGPGPPENSGRAREECGVDEPGPTGPGPPDKCAGRAADGGALKLIDKSTSRSQSVGSRKSTMINAQDLYPIQHCSSTMTYYGDPAIPYAKRQQGRPTRDVIRARSPDPGGTENIRHHILGPADTLKPPKPPYESPQKHSGLYGDELILSSSSGPGGGEELHSHYDNVECDLADRYYLKPGHGGEPLIYSSFGDPGGGRDVWDRGKSDRPGMLDDLLTRGASSAASYRVTRDPLRNFRPIDPAPNIKPCQRRGDIPHYGAVEPNDAGYSARDILLNTSAGPGGGDRFSLGYNDGDPVYRIKEPFRHSGLADEEIILGQSSGPGGGRRAQVVDVDVRDDDRRVCINVGVPAPAVKKSGRGPVGRLKHSGCFDSQENRAWDGGGGGGQACAPGRNPIREKSASAAAAQKRYHLGAGLDHREGIGVTAAEDRLGYAKDTGYDGRGEARLKSSAILKERLVGPISENPQKPQVPLYNHRPQSQTCPTNFAVGETVPPNIRPEEKPPHQDTPPPPILSRISEAARRTSELSPRHRDRRKKGITLAHLRNEIGFMGSKTDTKSTKPDPAVDAVGEPPPGISGGTHAGKDVHKPLPASKANFKTGQKAPLASKTSSSSDDGPVERPPRGRLKNATKPQNPELARAPNIDKIAKNQNPKTTYEPIDRGKSSSGCTEIEQEGVCEVREPPGPRRCRRGSSCRIFVKEGDIRMAIYDKSICLQDRYWFLFSDQLVVAKRSTLGNRDGPGEYRLKHKIPLDEIWIGDTEEEFIKALCGDKSHLQVRMKDAKQKEALKKLSRLAFLVGWPSINYVVTFRTQQERDDWYKTLNACVSRPKLGADDYRDEGGGARNTVPRLLSAPMPIRGRSSSHTFGNQGYHEVTRMQSLRVVRDRSICHDHYRDDNKSNPCVHNCRPPNIAEQHINLKLATKDLHNRPRAKYLNVATETTAREVVHQALNAFQIYSNASEYALIVGKHGGGNVNADDYRLIDKDKVTNANSPGEYSATPVGGHSSAVSTLVGPEIIMAYWRKSIRESITHTLQLSKDASSLPQSATQRAAAYRQKLEYYGQYYSFEQLDPQFRYRFELKRFRPNNSDKNALAIPTSQLSHILTTLVSATSDQTSLGDGDSIGDTSPASAASIATSLPFWKLKRKGANSALRQAITSQDTLNSEISSNASTQETLGLFGDKEMGLARVGVPQEIWLLLHVLSDRCAQVIGLFRKPAAAKQVRILKGWINASYNKRVESDGVSSGKNQKTSDIGSSNGDSSSGSGGHNKAELIERFEKSSVHSLACTLKEYLRAQDEPLLTGYDEWLVLSTVSELHGRLTILADLIQHKLCANRRQLLAAIVSILTKVCKATDVTAMTANSCAISLTPSLIWHPSSPAEDAKNVAAFIQIVEDTIVYSRKLFSDTELKKVEKRISSGRASSSDEDSTVSSEHSAGSSGVDSGVSGPTGSGGAGLSEKSSSHDLVDGAHHSETNHTVGCLKDDSAESKSRSSCHTSSKSSSIDSLDFLTERQQQRSTSASTAASNYQSYNSSHEHHEAQNNSSKLSTYDNHSNSGHHENLGTNPTADYPRQHHTPSAEHTNILLTRSDVPPQLLYRPAHNIAALREDLHDFDMEESFV